MSFSVDLRDSVAVNRQLCSDLYNFFVVSCFFFQASMFLREWLQLPYNYSTIFGVLDSLPDPAYGGRQAKSCSDQKFL